VVHNVAGWVHEVTLVVFAPVWLGFVPAHSSSTAAAQHVINMQMYCYGSAMWRLVWTDTAKVPRVVESQLVVVAKLL
jgi:hypothetical protein